MLPWQALLSIQDFLTLLNLAQLITSRRRSGRANSSSSPVLKITGQEHSDRYKPTASIEQWIGPAVDTQLNLLFHAQRYWTR